MLFTSASKVHQIEKEIDVARCKGRWQAIPDLARRYVKHNPKGKAMEHLLLAESALVRLGQAKKPWDSKQVLTIQNQLHLVIDSNDTAMDTLKESAKVVLARLFFGCQEYDRALDLLDDSLQLNTESQGYSFVLYYQAMAIKAMSLEMTDQTDTSLQTYEYISRLLDERLPIKDLTLVEWAEQTLYQLVTNQSSRLSINQETMLEFLRSYHQATSSQPVSWRTERRVDVHLQTIKHLSRMYRVNDYTSPLLADSGGPEDAQDRQQAFTDEIIQQYTICEHMLQTTLPFPKSGESNGLILELMELLADDLDLMILTLDDWRGYKEVLERTLEKSFNSPSILRLLFLVCLRLGEYEEAQHALHSYLQLVGLVSLEQIDTQKDGFAYVQDTQGRYVPQHSPLSSQQVSPHTSDGQQNGNGEPTKCQVKVLLESIRFFCKDLSKGTRAVEMADLALVLTGSSASSTDLDARQKSEIYRLSGVAYGLLASQTIDGEKRPQLHEKAISLLEQANATWQNSWETHYCLAIQHADMRNISKSIQSIRQSLDLNMHHPPSWHLLALALSCPGQQDHSQALAIAAAGLEVGDNGPASKCLSTYDQYEQQLLLKMTHNRILNASQGPEKALEEHASLLKLYGKWIAEGPNDDYIDFSLVDGGGDGNENAWYGQSFYGGDKVPRKLVVAGAFGNIPSTGSSSYSFYPVSSSSSSLAPATVKTHKSLRRRSASSSMINHFITHGVNDNSGDLTNCDSASVFTTSVPADKSANTIDFGAKGENVPPTLAHRSPGLRKYASNSTLKVPGSNPPSSHHWHGLHLFPSRSASRRSIAATSVNEGFGTYSNSKQTGPMNTKSTPRYNSVNSIQSSTSTGSGGQTATPTPSIYDSHSISHSSLSLPSLSLPSLLIPQKQGPAVTARGYMRHRKHHSRLCELWLMSAEWYLELHDSNEALKALAEAESVFPDHPDIWLLLGQISNSNRDNCKNEKADTDEDQQHQDQETASAIQFYEKGMLLQPGHVGCQLALAKLYVEQLDLCLAEGILTSMTQGFGWHSSEAWYLLGQLYQQTGRQEHTKNYLFYALDLETSRPVQPFDILPRFV